MSRETHVRFCERVGLRCPARLTQIQSARAAELAGAAPNSWTLGLDRSSIIGFYEIFSGTRVCAAQSRNVHWMGQAGRGQAEHWLQRVPDG